MYMAERMNNAIKLDDKEHVAKRIVDFFVFARLGLIGHRISECHLNRTAYFVMTITPKFKVVEVR
jgi:hypothetical protein